MEDDATSANSPPSRYPFYSKEAGHHYTLIESDAKDICEESDDETSPQKILEEVFESDLGNKVDYMHDEKEDD